MFSLSEAHKLYTSRLNFRYHNHFLKDGMKSLIVMQKARGFSVHLDWTYGQGNTVSRKTTCK